MLGLINCFYRRERGATAAEYAMLVVFIALALAVDAQALGGGLGNTLTNIGNDLLCSNSQCLDTSTKAGHRNARVAKRVLSFDDLVGASDKPPRKCQTRCIGGLEVDDQVEFCRLLDRQIGRLGALEDAVCENRSTDGYQE